MKEKKNNVEGTNKLLVKIIAEKLSKMDELEMGPVNVFLP
jgi:hypothetical protein